MLKYNESLKNKARALRKNTTESESILWNRLRGKQMIGVPFYRQKPIGNYILDFFAPRAKLVIEVDGSQHMETEHVRKDNERDAYLTGLGLKVLRFNSCEVIKETDAVVDVIYQAVVVQLEGEIPPGPLFQRGEI